MARYKQMNIYCEKCNKLYVGELVKEGNDKHICKVCGAECEIPDGLPPSMTHMSKINQDSDSYRWGRHIDEVKFQRWNIHKGEKKK